MINYEKFTLLNDIASPHTQGIYQPFKSSNHTSGVKQTQNFKEFCLTLVLATNIFNRIPFTRTNKNNNKAQPWIKLDKANISFS
ncbi:Hypothetical predicted protein [Octopus vulgaris]|uniref:Uncharacterized protein n=1 Tax=Octopus vulgaris TaxID=6645 RepID=A0AA36B5Z4_OCTVU|nr:Hypothetical predicted protein [Octopus vulgaris]